MPQIKTRRACRSSEAILPKKARRAEAGLTPRAPHQQAVALLEAADRPRRELERRLLLYLGICAKMVLALAAISTQAPRSIGRFFLGEEWRPAISHDRFFGSCASGEWVIY